jgi:polysaccharide export outer membrane protein
MRLIGLLSSLMGVALLAGCATAPAPPDSYHPELVSAYQLDSGDRLRIIVFGQPDLSNTYAISQGGTIAMPLIGAIPARGHTTGQIEADISAKLRNGYLRRPDVSVEIDRYRPFFAMGEVGAAGQYPYVPGMTVQQAVAAAGGFTPRADVWTVRVTRSVGGRVGTADLGLNEPVLPGDTLYVRERHL